MVKPKKESSLGAVRACQHCKDVQNVSLDREAMKTICGGCRDVLKADLVIALFGQNTPILTKEERFTGRKNPLTKRNVRSIIARYKRRQSMTHLAEVYGVSYSLINKTIPKELHRKAGRYKNKRKKP